jgi:purine-binding chemotaxis protein CheW
VLTQIAGRWLALPVEQVVETMRPLPIVIASDAPPCVLGTARIRGEQLRVIDAARLFGLTSQAAPTRFIVVRTKAALVALQVDAVIDVRALGAGEPPGHVELPELGPTLRDARWIEELG